jgi:recombination protein RecT
MAGRVGQEVAQRQQQQGGGAPVRTSLVKVLHDMRPEIERALPKGLDADRMARLALTVIRQVPKLALSTPESFAGALLTASALGLEPGLGSESEAWLVPYEDRKKGIVECQLILGYKGISKLFYQHPLARHLDAQVVYENDEFDYAYGSEQYLHHKPARGDRGAVIGYYAIATLSTGAMRIEFLTPEEVKAIRGKEGPNGGIRDPQHWMERKTVLKQVLKPMPKSAVLSYALIADEKSGAQLAADKTPEAITGQPVAEQQPEPDVDHPAIEQGQEEVPPGVDPKTGEVIESAFDQPAPPAAGDDPWADPPKGPAAK